MCILRACCGDAFPQPTSAHGSDVYKLKTAGAPSAPPSPTGIIQLECTAQEIVRRLKNCPPSRGATWCGCADQSMSGSGCEISRYDSISEKNQSVGISCSHPSTTTLHAAGTHTHMV
ncbi:hypothetical protein PoB_000156900 [Plakobranchus ocellatus]|uniref:Uncharacterized protein n=1 Tax=Plakobranchus ocellatus TaxID=259542 RepID=A0AAV3XYP4_9GAST|nr:hypothetical protein PoB_000156900 [Plakobranchus ocellatus]